MDCYGFEGGLAVLVVPPMPPVCLIVGAPECGEPAVPPREEFPLVVVHGPGARSLVLRPGDRLVALTRGEGDLEALCRESRSRHGGWNAHALGDAVRALMVHGVAWGSRPAEAELLPLAA